MPKCFKAPRHICSRRHFIFYYHFSEKINSGDSHESRRFTRNICKKIVADDILFILYYFFFQRNCLDILQTIHMKYHDLFSVKENKKKHLKMPSATCGQNIRTVVRTSEPIVKMSQSVEKYL